MNVSESKSQSGGIGFVGLLTICFIVLKLCGVIAWSWWWVLSPILICFGLVFAIIGAYLGFLLGCAAYKALK
jgi:hypothetical protein